MLKKILRSLLGIWTFFLIVLVCLIVMSSLFLLAPFKFFLPVRRWRNAVSKFMDYIPNFWGSMVSAIIRHFMNIEWDVRGLEGLNLKDWYLLLSNHSSWTDIVVLYCVFSYKIPSQRFFMKRELLWQLPFAAQACQLMGFPFMKRYSKEYLAKHPEDKGKDLEATRKACERFKDTPVTIVNFVEGGRFSNERHRKQKSLYQYLLRPKAGGTAYVLSAMGDNLHTIINTTIVYPNEPVNFWDFLCGRLTKIVVCVETIPITADLRGDYENDPVFRTHLQEWLNQLWQKKDEQIARIIADNKQHVSNAIPNTG